MHEVIIVGSGPAGTSAALQLAGRDVLMLDVGFDAPTVPEDFDGDLYTLKKTRSDLFPSLVGEQYESLANLFAEPKVNLKLKSPYMGFIIHRWRELAPIETQNFEGVISLAKGGLANAWGAGVYRFTDDELKEFPLGYSDLAPYYDALTSHIGISGANDDLAPWFHADSGLQTPIRLGVMAADLLQRYEKRRELFNSEGIYIGRTRLAVLTREHRGRRPYAYDHMEFFRPHLSPIYTPAFTLNELIQSRQVDYRQGWLVERFSEVEGGIEVHAKHVDSGRNQVFRARKLLLGAGALNSARIVLSSVGDTQTRLPILDNPMAAFPVLRLDRVGKAMDPDDASVGQLNFISAEPGRSETIHASFYGTSGSLRSDVLFDFPLPVRASCALLKYTASAGAIAMVFYPGVSHTENYLRLTTTGALEINYAPEPHTGVFEHKLIRLLGKVGYRSHAKLVQYLPMGSGVHYAGMLPMRVNPGPYQCYPDGRLAGTRAVHVIDGACFPALPAKNLTFTIMANAMRIANGAVKAT